MACDPVYTFKRGFSGPGRGRLVVHTKHFSLFSMAPCRCRSWAVRTLLFALLWWFLTGGDPGSWPIGAPVALLAARVSVALLPPVSLSLSGLMRFIPFFLWHSVRAGADVARRALDPAMPIAPGLHRHAWRLPPGFARVFMANTVTLLPGTLSAELDDDSLLVHMLDKRWNCYPELCVIEALVADLFRQPLSPEREGCC